MTASVLKQDPNTVRGKVRRTGRIFTEHVERSFLDPKHSFVAKQKFAQEQALGYNL